MKKNFKYMVYACLCAFALSSAGDLTATKRNGAPGLGFDSTQKELADVAVAIKDITGELQSAFLGEDSEEIDSLMSQPEYRACFVKAVNDTTKNGELAFWALSWAVEKGDQAAIGLLLGNQDACEAIINYCNALNDSGDVDPTANARDAYNLLRLAKTKKYDNVVELILKACWEDEMFGYLIVGESVERGHVDMFNFLISRNDVRDSLESYFPSNQDCAVMVINDAIRHGFFCIINQLFALRGIVYDLSEIAEMLKCVRDECKADNEKKAKITRRIMRQLRNQMRNQAHNQARKQAARIVRVAN